jgi:hypothetical protein
MFAAIIVNRTYSDIMNKDKALSSKSRLGEVSKYNNIINMCIETD